MFKSIPAKGIQFPRLPKFFGDAIWASKSSVLVREMRPRSSLKQSLLGAAEIVSPPVSSYCLLPIFYFPRQDWWWEEGGWGGGG